MLLRGLCLWNIAIVQIYCFFFRCDINSAIITLFLYLLEHVMLYVGVVLNSNIIVVLLGGERGQWLIHKLFTLFFHGKKSSSVFSGLHTLVKIWLDNVLSLTDVLCSLLVARQLQMLVDRICVILLLIVVLFYDLFWGFNSAKGIAVHRVCLLKRTFYFHVDFIVVCK